MLKGYHSTQYCKGDVMRSKFTAIVISALFLLLAQPVIVYAATTGTQSHSPSVMIFSAEEFDLLAAELSLMQFADIPALIRPATLGWRYQPRLFVYDREPGEEQLRCFAEQRMAGYGDYEFQKNQACSRYIYIVVFDQDSAYFNLRVRFPGWLQTPQLEAEYLPELSANGCDQTIGYLCKLTSETDHTQIATKTYRIRIPDEMIASPMATDEDDTNNVTIHVRVSDQNSTPTDAVRKMIFRKRTENEFRQSKDNDADGNNQCQDSAQVLLQSACTGVVGESMVNPPENATVIMQYKYSIAGVPGAIRKHAITGELSGFLKAGILQLGVGQNLITKYWDCTHHQREEYYDYACKTSIDRRFIQDSNTQELDIYTWKKETDGNASILITGNPVSPDVFAKKDYKIEIKFTDSKYPEAFKNTAVTYCNTKACKQHPAGFFSVRISLYRDVLVFGREGNILVDFATKIHDAETFVEDGAFWILAYGISHRSQLITKIEARAHIYWTTNVGDQFFQTNWMCLNCDNATLGNYKPKQIPSGFDMVKNNRAHLSHSGAGAVQGKRMTTESTSVGQQKLMLARLTVKFPGIANVHVEVRIADNIFNKATGDTVEKLDWLVDQADIEVFRQHYDLIIRHDGLTRIIDDVDCSSGTCALDNLVTPLTVKFPGISSAHVDVRVVDGISGKATGDIVEKMDWQTDQAVFKVFRQHYDLIIRRGALTHVIDDVDCSSGACVVENVVTPLTVRFPGISSAHVSVSVVDGISGRATGDRVDNLDWQTDQTVLTVLRQHYDLIIRHGAVTHIIDDVDCSSGTCVVENLVAPLTVKFPGLSTVHVDVRVVDDITGSASGNHVTNLDWQSDQAVIRVLRQRYDLSIRHGASTYYIDNVDCTSGVCVVDALQ